MSSIEEVVLKEHLERLEQFINTESALPFNLHDNVRKLSKIIRELLEGLG